MTAKEDYLKALGLSNYEVKVFLALLKLGQSKARTISRESSVPYGRIYDVITSLNQKGLLSIIKSRPKVFTPMTPEVAIETLLKRQKSEMDRLEKEKKEMKKQFQVAKTIAPAEERERVSIYYGTDASIKLGQMGIQRTKKEMLMSTTRLVDPVGQLLIREQLKRDVKTKIMIPAVTKKNRENVKEIKRLGGEIRTGGISGMKLGITDDQASLLIVVNPKNPEGFISIVVEGEDFARGMKEYFNSRWRKARKV